MDLSASKTMIEYPINLEWIIAEERLKALKESTNNQHLQSDKFTAFHGSDVKYFLRCYPNGYNEYRGKTRISLNLEFENEKKIESEFTLSVKSAEWSCKIDHIYEKSMGWGIPCCSTNELFESGKKFIVDGKLTVKVKGILKVENKVTKRILLEPKRKITKGFYDLWTDGYEDFSIAADGKEIKVHKCVIACQSPVFDAMFKPHTKEAIENKVEIPDFTFDIVEKAVKFCYKQFLVSDVSMDECLLLLKFADKYDITNLKDNLGDYMGGKLTVSNVCEICKCAVDGNALKLQNKCLDFFVLLLSKKEFVPNMEMLEKSFLINAFKYSSVQKCETL